MMKKLICAVIGFVIATVSIAGTPERICAPVLNIYFSNGMQNNPNEAGASVDHLKFFVLPNALPAQYSNVEGLFHPEDGLFGDLAEVFLQKANEAANVNLPFAEKVRAWFGLPNTGAEALSTFFADWAKYTDNRTAEQLSKDRLPEAAQRIAQDVQRDLGVITAQLASGNKVLIISHSQGNLFANSIYESLMAGPYQQDALDRLALVGVASAAGIIYQDGVALTGNTGTYVTATNDGIINLLRGKVALTGGLSPLESNATSVAAKDLPGHGFVETYNNQKDPIHAQVSAAISKQGRHLLDKTLEAVAFVREYRADESGYDLSDFGASPPVDTVNPQNGKLLARTTVSLEGSLLVFKHKFYCDGLPVGDLTLQAMYDPAQPPHNFKSTTLVNGKTTESWLALPGTLNGNGYAEVAAGTATIAQNPDGTTVTFN